MDLDETPTLHLGQRTGLHDADGVAHASGALLVVSVKLLGAGHHLAVLGVALALRGLDNDGLVARDGDDDTRADLARITLSRFSHALTPESTRPQRSSPLQSDGRAAREDTSDVLLHGLDASGVVQLAGGPSGNEG